MLQQYLPFTVLKRTEMYQFVRLLQMLLELQQYLPFTVLKPNEGKLAIKVNIDELQQYLPFTVLKPLQKHDPMHNALNPS